MGLDYNKAAALTSQVSALNTSILNARLSLTRLRQAHPSPRLTIPAAEARLDAQSDALQSLDDRLSLLRKQVASAKERVREEGKAVESLRVARVEAARKAKGEGDKAGEEGQLAPIYDWFVLNASVSS